MFQGTRVKTNWQVTDRPSATLFLNPVAKKAEWREQENEAWVEILLEEKKKEVIRIQVFPAVLSLLRTRYRTQK